jgi:hypothetical protein
VSADEEDRRDWIDGVSRRLGLVTEVHRCRVFRFGWQDWGWHCLRPGCSAGSNRAYPQAEAFAAALAHARSFLPEQPEEEPGVRLDLTGAAILPGAAQVVSGTAQAGGGIPLAILFLAAAVLLSVAIYTVYRTMNEDATVTACGHSYQVPAGTTLAVTLGGPSCRDLGVARLPY